MMIVRDTSIGVYSTCISVAAALITIAYAQALSALISPFSVSGAHGHWVGSTDTPSHSTKELEMR